MPLPNDTHLMSVTVDELSAIKIFGLDNITYIQVMILFAHIAQGNIIHKNSATFMLADIV